MNRILAVLFFAFTNLSLHSGLCSVKVLKAYSQNVFGKNVGYYVEFINKSGKSIDAIEWKVKFYNNFNDFKGERKGEWSSGNFIKPIKNGAVMKDLEGVWVDGATKIVIEIKRVHYTDGNSCQL